MTLVHASLVPDSSYIAFFGDSRDAAADKVGLIQIPADP
jgi:hypothetical protein